VPRGRVPSDDQRAAVHAAAAAWRDLPLSVAPADRDVAERAALALYRAASLPRPRVLWLPSPLHGALAAAYLTASWPARRDPLAAHLEESVLVALDQVQAARPGNRGWRELHVGRVMVGGQHPRSTRAFRTWADHELQRLLGPAGGVRWAVDSLLGPLLDRRFGDRLGRHAGTWLWRGTDAGTLQPLPARMDADARAAGVVADHPLLDLARSVGRWWAFTDALVLADRPRRLRLDLREAPGAGGRGLARLHATDGPALDMGDDWRIWAVDGVRMPRQAAEAPETLTVAQIQAEPDVETRRVMLQRFGYERYLLEAGMTELHRDRYGVLYSSDVPGDEPLVMVEVTNATIEPDGRLKRHLLRVPPTVGTAHEAVAWTFGQRPASYRPRLES
jgi:hypothetical protein